ncbi:MAG: hypothetical protein A2V50_04460 [Bacteroidetes bacterium RBG_19FT_COMBO_42_10]|nr:MAG: hypothetical protein A2V50_04460 [Bacteroidetes bacterium RBG_19FT_COMBO_42_10]
MKNAVRLPVVLFLIICLAGKSALAQQGDELLFYKHIGMSAWNGVYYGLAADHIFEIKDEKAAVAIPIITAGTLALIPLFTNENRAITSNQLLLTGHGQLIGWAHGGSLALLINGDNSFDEGKSKLTVGLAALTSIGLGIAGKQLATKMDWSEGRVALYRHYGLAGPLTGVSTCLIFSEDARALAGSVLLSGAASYLLADRVNRWHEFTRGEIRATQALTIMNGVLGVCILADIEPEDINTPAWIFPAIGLAGGTALGHMWLKDLNLTPRQGMTTLYAAGLGALIGEGLAILIRSDNADFNAVDYLFPYTAGMLTYSLAVSSLKKKNSIQACLPEKKSSSTWDFALMPQNLYINNKLGGNSNLLNNRYFGMQPIFAASCTF